MDDWKDGAAGSGSDRIHAGRRGHIAEVCQ